MATIAAGLPDDIDALKATILAERAKRQADEALIAHVKLQIAKLNRDRFGPRTERTSRLLDQLELQLEEAEASAKTSLPPRWLPPRPRKFQSSPRKWPARKPFPEHLPREPASL